MKRIMALFCATWFLMFSVGGCVGNDSSQMESSTATESSAENSQTEESSVVEQSMAESSSEESSFPVKSKAIT